MKFVDFNLLCQSQNGSIFLDAAVAEFLFKQNNKFLPSKFGGLSADLSKSSKLSLSRLSSKIAFSHNLVRSGENQWHIIENTQKGEGGFGAVNGSKFKIVLTKTKKNKKSIYSAQMIPVSDVVKIQKPSKDLPYQKLLERAVKEARNQHNHGVNIVTVVDAADMVITVLADCGISLDKLLPFKPGTQYSFQFRLGIAARIASEMLLLQQKGVVHRDLKPANICYKKLPKDQFHIIFIDFGLAEEVDSKQNFNTSGTYCYMAPEVIEGKGSTYQSDMYALSAILGEVFGAENILKYKERAKYVNQLITAQYCFDGLFSDYDVSPMDPYLLEDIKSLLMKLQSIDPKARPTIDQVNKFFITLEWRMNEYKVFNDDWARMTACFEQFESYHQQMNLLKKSHKLDKFKANYFNAANPLSTPFNRAMIQQREAIYKAIHAFTLPQSHYHLSERLVKENRLVDADGVDRPYPDLKKVTQMMEQENRKFKKALSSFNECTGVITDGKNVTKKFMNTNSTGIIAIANILESKQSPLEKLHKLQQIGQEKTMWGLSNFYSHSKIFGKGRHENVDKLYKKLANLAPEKAQQQEEYLAKSQLDEITQFIRTTSTFTH